MGGIRYVALGDSYTIGERVQPGERWPDLLTRHLRDAGLDVELVANPSVTGWTTAQLIEHELPVLERSSATFVTVLIGVNDWVQEVPAETFRERFGTILDRVAEQLADSRKILAITIPDFSVTPEGSTYSRGRDISAGIAGFNAIIVEKARQREVRVVDIYPLSQTLGGREFVTEDGLHPSGKAYARWDELILPHAMDILGESPHPS